MNGLILLGGKSKRMGVEKALLCYHGVPQWEYLYNLLTPYCEEVFFSCRPDQLEQQITHNRIEDLYQCGPLGGILSAFDLYPSQTWLVVACDMPYVNESTIKFLIENRSTAHDASVFVNPQIEPLLAIYEPALKDLIQMAWQNSTYSLTEILKNASTHFMQCPNPLWLTNINEQADFKKFFE